MVLLLNSYEKMIMVNSSGQLLRPASDSPDPHTRHSEQQAQVQVAVARQLSAPANKRN